MCNNGRGYERKWVRKAKGGKDGRKVIYRNSEGWRMGEGMGCYMGNGLGHEIHIHMTSWKGQLDLIAIRMAKPVASVARLPG